MTFGPDPQPSQPVFSGDINFRDWETTLDQWFGLPNTVFPHPASRPAASPAVEGSARLAPTLVATDMDGTLTVEEKFTPRVLQALADLGQAGLTVLIVTGRSAGWVNGLVHYLPISGAIAENGGLFYSPEQADPVMLSAIDDVSQHRQMLLTQFQRLQQRYPQLIPSRDNPFRLTDWTFDVAGLSPTDLEWLAACCQDHGWGFTYSTVQCHIKPPNQDKAPGLRQVMQRQFPDLTPLQVITVGDSPNDESLFDPQQFPRSVGVANIAAYLDRLAHRPRLLTSAVGGVGFCQLAQALIRRSTLGR